jgi:hypothetical protein
VTPHFLKAQNVPGVWQNSHVRQGLSFILLGAVTLLACPPGPTPDVDAGPVPKGVCEAPRPTPLRLLTRVEYNNTVRDVLGDESRPADTLPREPVAFGFENNAELLQLTADGVSRVLDVAELTAAKAVRDNKSRLVSCATFDAACGQRFIATVGRRLFRRTLDVSETAALEKLFRETSARDGFDTALEWTLAAMLQSPQFLYRPELGTDFSPRVASIPLSSWDMASKLSYFLWASGPDDALLDAAGRDQLKTNAELEAQVSRMLADPKAVEGLAYAFRQLLRTPEIGSLEKTASVYPQWSPRIAESMRTSLELYFEHIAKNDSSLPGLMTSPVVFVNDAMAEYAPGAPNASFVAVTMPVAERRGLLTQPALLARLAGPDQSSPIRRGIFVLEKLMCQPPPPPPGNANITPPALDPSFTTRERFAQHTADENCAQCHKLIDPVGNSFEGFDGAGRRRTMESGKPVDTTGGVTAAGDTELVGPVASVLELGQKLSRSRQVHDCMASHFMRFALGRADGSEDACSLKDAQDSFWSTQGRFDALRRTIVMSSSFRTRASPEVAP